MARPPQDERARLEKFKALQPSGCIEWTGTVKKGGYGKAYFRGRQAPAHRAAYVLEKGEIPDGLYVCHSCDNRKCVNVAHLFLGTSSENFRDMVDKKRHWGRRLITDEALLLVQALLAGKNFSQASIGKIVNIHQTAISSIALGRRAYL